MKNKFNRRLAPLNNFALGKITAKQYSTRGFTLIELLVVIAIIGMLAATVLTSLGAARSKGRDAKRISDLKNIELALALYADSNKGKCPAAIANLVSTYMTSEPKDPSDDKSYKYQCTGNKYHVGASLENGSPSLDVDCDGANFDQTWGKDTNPCTSGDTGLYCLDFSNDSICGKNI